MDEPGGGRKRSTNSDSKSSYKRTREIKINDSSSCETHQQFRHKAENSSLFESHVTNTSLLQGKQLRQEFVKELIKRRPVNLWNNSASGNDSSCDLDGDEKTSVDVCHHDDLHCNHPNKVQLSVMSILNVTC